MASLPHMHTAEHILTHILISRFGATRNYEMHLTQRKGKCDYDVPHDLTPEELAEIERMVNEVIARDLPVEAEVIPLEEAQGKYDLWKVPEGVREIRIVRIGDFDATPCVGEHAERTGELGRFVIVSAERKEDGLFRVRFKLRPPPSTKGPSSF